jgi:D-alanyl-D-alanine carboxypeptidase/D-alanyl-D-alanine-endopeptidase (penicillin-binding protein 4)
MRVFLAVLGATVSLLAGTAAAAGAQGTPPALAGLQRSLTQSMAQEGAFSGAEVVDMTTGQTLYAQNPATPRLPASVEKLYTTSTALLELGPTATFTTSILGTGARDPNGAWHGSLYLRGGGDPTLGSVSFDQSWYGTGTTLHRLIESLLATTGITSVQGRIVGDGSFLDGARGTPATGYQRSSDVEGQLGGLIYDRGFTSSQATAFQTRPVLFAAQQLAGGLRAWGVQLGPRFPVSAGRTPAGAQLLASVSSPPVGTLIALANTPSDNYIAEMLLKDIGARLGGAGTTAAGAAVVRGELQSGFGITPRLDDGSGLSRYDATSPQDVVTLLQSMATNSTFVNSLALAGVTGTLQHEMQGTIAQGNCRGKTGTLIDVANLVGYCRARDGHQLAFAFLANGLGNPSLGHAIEANMAVAVANYNG